MTNPLTLKVGLVANFSAGPRHPLTSEGFDGLALTSFRSLIAKVGATVILRATLGASLLLMASASAPAASVVDTIEPGLWSYSASTLITGGRNGEQCVRPDQIEEFLTGPRNRHYRCVYPRRSIGGGDIAFAGDCLDKGDRNRYHLEVRGHYKADSFELQGVVTGTFLGLPISLPVSIRARRLAAECRLPN